MQTKFSKLASCSSLVNSLTNWGATVKTPEERQAVHALIVYCHPEPQSFTGALKDVGVETLRRLGHTVEISDLHGEGFDPVEKADHYATRKDPDFFNAMVEQRHASRTGSLPADVRREIARLERADLVVLQFPLWWHAQPAMLKGWCDRVFVNGGLYTSTMRYNRGYFRGNRAICAVTAGAPKEAFEGSGRGGDIEAMLWPIQYSLYYMGFTVLPSFVAYGVQVLAGRFRVDRRRYDERLERHKAAWSHQLETLERLEPVAFPGWDDWDEDGVQKLTATKGVEALLTA